MSNEPRINKSKEQIVAEMKMNEEAKSRRIFVKKFLFPFLLENTESVDDAQIICEALSQTVRMAFNQKMVNTLFKELNIPDMMNKDAVNAKKMIGLVKLVENESIANALRILDEIPMAITDKIRAEGKNRKLVDLKLEFND